MRDRHRLPPGAAVFVLLACAAVATAWGVAALIVRGLT